MSFWQNKVILVTGGTGSFGQAFSRRILDEPIARLRIFSRDEFKQSEMAQAFPDSRIRFVLGDVRDRQRVVRALDGVDVVVHAAALKQVPACEYNPFEAIQTNVIGAANIIDAAIDRGVERVLALSTDKACNPINLYGATKLCSEKLFIDGNSYAGGRPTRFAAVRYGNVVGSRGSVVPLFIAQKAASKPLTITDGAMTRFWISLPQAVDFVRARIEEMAGGELFIPLLPAADVLTIAKAISPESVLSPIGIRVGEKVHETLIGWDESRQARRFQDGFVIRRDVPAEPPFVYDSAHAKAMSVEDVRSQLAALGFID